MDAVAVAAVNMFFFGLLASPLFLLRHLIYGLDNISRETDRFNYYRVIPELFVCAVIVDMWFYWTHRLIHEKNLYKVIHKMHHRFKVTYIWTKSAF